MRNWPKSLKVLMKLSAANHHSLHARTLLVQCTGTPSLGSSAPRASGAKRSTCGTSAMTNRSLGSLPLPRRARRTTRYSRQKKESNLFLKRNLSFLGAEALHRSRVAYQLTERACTTYHDPVLNIFLGFPCCSYNNHLPEGGHFQPLSSKSQLKIRSWTRVKNNNKQKPETSISAAMNEYKLCDYI